MSGGRFLLFPIKYASRYAFCQYIPALIKPRRLLIATRDRSFTETRGLGLFFLLRNSLSLEKFTARFSTVTPTQKLSSRSPFSTNHRYYANLPCSRLSDARLFYCSVNCRRRCTISETNCFLSSREACFEYLRFEVITLSAIYRDQLSASLLRV